MLIREVDAPDLSQLLQLYTYLHDNTMPVISNEIDKLWRRILTDPNYHIIIGVINNIIISSCVLTIIPNLTHNQKPYALVENVITHPGYRKNGYATQILNFAKDIAIENECYKIMLMTSSKLATTLQFYEKVGYNQNDKTAFIQWLS